MTLRTPILFLVFNRPEATKMVFEQIRRQRPAQLFLAADGPRATVPADEALCGATRAAVLDNIDWPCEVHTLLRTRNLGCGQAVSAAIDWFFEQVTEGIILEDDCVPDPTFFSFCEVLLEKYRLRGDVLHINGSNYQQGVQRGNGSYYFSRYAHIWGWATWRRAWKQYDFSLARYQQCPREGLNAFLRAELQAVCEGRTDTWDIQWFMSVWFSHGKAITPQVNLVRNIGYGEGATHTQAAPKWFKRLQYGRADVMMHPPEVCLDEAADRYTLQTLYNRGPVYMRLKSIVKNSPILFNLCKRVLRHRPVS